MSTDTKINLVDPDYRRRAKIAHMLMGQNRHVEPYDGLADFSREMPPGGLWLVLDEDNLVAAIAEQAGMADVVRTIIAYSPDPQLRKVVAAMQAGASDYIAWPMPVEELTEAIEMAENMVRPQSAHLHRAARARERVRCLTRREREILVSVATGCTNREIAQSLGISHRTVEIHRSNMLTKLQAANSPDAVRIAVDAGLMD